MTVENTQIFLTKANRTFKNRFIILSYSMKTCVYFLWTAIHVIQDKKHKRKKKFAVPFHVTDFNFKWKVRGKNEIT